MGNTKSAFSEQVEVDPWWDNARINGTQTQAVQTESQTTTDANEERIMEAKQEISSLHQKRLKLIAEKKKEFDDLRRELAQTKNENEELKKMLKQTHGDVVIQKWDTSKVDESQQTDTFEVPGQLECQDLKTKMEELQLELVNAEITKQKNRDLQVNVAELQNQLQKVNAELAVFETERQEYKTHVIALKDIIAVSKQLLLMREDQIKQLTQKVAQIQATLSEKELQVLSDDLREEYERQLKNIKQLKTLYEERQQADRRQVDSLKSQLDDAKNALKVQEASNSEIQERVDELEKDNVEKSGSIITLQSQLGFAKAECGELRSEMTVINQLFSQILSGFNNNQDVDLDKLIKILEENHDLLTDIVVNEECTEISSALPKVLLDLVSQVNNKTNTTTAPSSQEEPQQSNDTTLTTIAEESESQTSTQQNSLSSASEIVQNLPKVWRVLTELLSHQATPVSVLNESGEQTDKDPCYKSVQTPTGPAMVLSVSQTFIRLKNLILEKKSLEKETTRLKQLNTHLETRLQDQEKRLELVSHELSKTWHVVGKMQKQHQQLHTQEKILRYELAQKRKLLNELKEELEYCREKWLQAREKNNTTEEQWKQLRTEFASRKKTVSEDLNNSVESGYSDERESSSDDDEAAEFGSEVSVSSPEPTPGCSSISENLETVSELQEGTDSVETVICVATREQEASGETILKVIQDEIANIEQTDVGSSSQDVSELAASIETESTPIAEQISDEHNTGNHPLECPTSSQTEEESQGDGSTDEVHSEETLKTDLVQNESKEVQKTSRTPEQMFAAREERLQRLEQEAKDLVTQTTNTSNRSIQICTKLEDLHEQYGGDPGTRRRDIDDMYKKLEEDILQTIKKTQGGDEYPSTSRQNRTTEEILAAREERLKRLEEESNQLVNKATKTSHRSIEISSKLDDLHQHYGESSKQNQSLLEESNTTEDIIPSTSSLQNSTTEETSTEADLNTEEQHKEQSSSIAEASVSSNEASTSSMTQEEIFARREERLQRMEQEARELMGKALKNSFRGLQFCTKLTRLHDRYGASTDSSDEAADDNNNTADTDNAVNGDETQTEDNSQSNDGSANADQAEDPHKEQS